MTQLCLQFYSHCHQCYLLQELDVDHCVESGEDEVMHNITIASDYPKLDVVDWVFGFIKIWI